MTRDLGIWIIALTLAFSVGAPGLAAAPNAADNVLSGINTTAEQAQLSTGDKSQSPTDNLAIMVGRAINYLFGIIGAIFLVVILIGGYEWMAAGGNSDNIAKAKTFILNGIFGLIVIFVAYALVYTILASLAGSTGNNGTWP